jgi:hypothetical protein
MTAKKQIHSLKFDFFVFAKIDEKQKTILLLEQLSVAA